MITRESLRVHLQKLWERNQFFLAPDMKRALERARDAEETELARLHFTINLESLEQTSKARFPLCGDTGLPMYYMLVGERAVGALEGGVAALAEELREAVRDATRGVPMRVNVVDPLTRADYPDNVGRTVPVVNQRLEPEADYLEITAVSLGGGAELMGQAARILAPLDGIKGIQKFLIDCVVRTDSGKNCNPQVVGVGIGGSMDVAASLAKQAAILRSIGERHPDPAIAALERELVDVLNGLGLGPWGVGGKSTVLDVLIETAETHIVTLPVAVYMQCPALRRMTIRFYADGRVEEDVPCTWLRRG
jgi:tartrate/fumarate subfamily iron-sulfur-dependent hydro-lyase alpha chain